MTDNNKGNLGFIFVIIAIIIALFNPIIGIISLLLVYFFAIAESNYTGQNADYPLL